MLILHFILHFLVYSLIVLFTSVSFFTDLFFCPMPNKYAAIINNMWWWLFLLVVVVSYSHQMVSSLVSECYIIINEKQALVLQRLASAIQGINLYQVDSAISFPSTYPLYSDLSFCWIALSNASTTRARTPYCTCPVRKKTSITNSNKV